MAGSGMWKVEGGSRKVEAGRWKPEGGSRMLEARKWKLEGGSWKHLLLLGTIKSILFILFSLFMPQTIIQI